MEETRKKIKILHCSDIHLDAPFIGLTGENADERSRPAGLGELAYQLLFRE